MSYRKFYNVRLTFTPSSLLRSCLVCFERAHIDKSKYCIVIVSLLTVTGVPVLCGIPDSIGPPQFILRITVKC